MANTLAKALASRYAYRWQFVDFLGPDGNESAGVVDIVAIRKSSKKPLHSGLKSLDAFDIILMQVKGGDSRKPTPEDIERLRLVGERYHAEAIVLFEWNKKKRLTRFRLLLSDPPNPADPWDDTTAAQLFGKRSRSTKTSLELSVAKKTDFLKMFKQIENVKSWRGYERPTRVRGVDADSGGELSATTDFWVNKAGGLVIRFKCDVYVYCYEQVLKPGGPCGDDIVTDAFCSDVHDLLQLWMLEGADYPPFYHLEY
jgi:hypothetical protein